MKKLIFTIAGAVTFAASVAVIVDFSVRKANKKRAYSAELIGGIAGVAAGIALALYPQIEDSKKLALHDMLDEEDERLMNQNISEVLNENSVNQKKNGEPRKIEVDEDATIEDFM